MIKHCSKCTKYETSRGREIRNRTRLRHKHNKFTNIIPYMWQQCANLDCPQTSSTHRGHKRTNTTVETDTTSSRTQVQTCGINVQLSDGHQNQLGKHKQKLTWTMWGGQSRLKQVVLTIQMMQHFTHKFTSLKGNHHKTVTCSLDKVPGQGPRGHQHDATCFLKETPHGTPASPPSSIERAHKI